MRTPWAVAFGGSDGEAKQGKGGSPPGNAATGETLGAGAPPLPDRPPP